MSKVWKKLDKSYVWVWAGPKGIVTTSICFSPEKVNGELSEHRDYSAITTRDDVDALFPCCCSIFFMEPVNVTFSGIPIKKITVFCCIDKPLLTRFNLASGSCIRYAEFGDYEPMLNMPDGLMIEEDEFAPLSFLFGMLPREYYNEARLTNTDLSTWKWNINNEKV